MAISLFTYPSTSFLSFLAIFFLCSSPVKAPPMYLGSSNASPARAIDWPQMTGKLKRLLINIPPLASKNSLFAFRLGTASDRDNGEQGNLFCNFAVLCWLAKGYTFSGLEKKPQKQPKGPSGSKSTAGRSVECSSLTLPSACFPASPQNTCGPQAMKRSSHSMVNLRERAFTKASKPKKISSYPTSPPKSKTLHLRSFLQRKTHVSLEF